MSKSLAESVLETFSAVELPAEIAARFDVLELLGKNDMGETFLLQEKEGAKWYVLKSFTDTKATYSEPEILKKLEHKGLPKFEPEIIGGETVFTLREYIEGVPLDEYVAESGVLGEAEAVQILAGLCDIMTVLHSHAIIHRDIKPSNVIFNPIDNSVSIIDFGISRKYNENSSKDTTVYATMEFASPEQFGFAQTDARSDIYSLGVLLRYMLTGKTEPGTPISSKALENIARKCTELAPKERFQNAAALKKALKNKPRTVSKALPGMAAAFLLGVAATLLAVLIFSESTFPREAEPYVFREPLVEQTVRIALGMDDYTPITYGDLEAVTSIQIYGMNPFVNYYTLPEGEGIRGRGSIRSLEDFARMPNLRELHLYYQPIDDISPLANNRDLRYLRLERVNVSDITPLAGHTNLEILGLRDTLIREWYVLETIPRLSYLQLWGNGRDLNIRSVSDLGDVSNLDYLSIKKSPGFECLEGIQNLPWLGRLSLYQTGVRDFSPINDINTMPRLYHLYLSPDKLPYLHTITRTDIEIVVWEDGMLRVIQPEYIDLPAS